MRRGSITLLGTLVCATACSDEPTSSTTPRVVAPPCAQPAPLEGQFNPRAPLKLVVFRDGVAADTEISRLAAKFTFTPTSTWTFGFAATLTPEVLAGVRCEPVVRLVEHDAVLTIDRR